MILQVIDVDGCRCRCYLRDGHYSRNHQWWSTKVLSVFHYSHNFVCGTSKFASNIIATGPPLIPVLITLTGLSCVNIILLLLIIITDYKPLNNQFNTSAKICCQNGALIPEYAISCNMEI